MLGPRGIGSSALEKLSGSKRNNCDHLRMLVKPVAATEPKRNPHASVRARPQIFSLRNSQTGASESTVPCFVGQHGGVIRNRDPDARLDDLTALMEARTSGELHRALVLGPPAAYEREVSMPLIYFRNVHDTEPARAAETAMLLATDPRWRVTAASLIEAIDATGIVPPDELDVLARAFIKADANVYWTCPDDWFSTIGIVISETDVLPGSPDDTDDKSHDTDEPRQTVAARVVSPGIRRWASARAVRLDPTVWADVYARSEALGGESGGGLMRGILDSIDVLPIKARTLIRREALKSGRSDVRQAALQQIAVLDWSLARTLGLRDANERVRRWASNLGEPATAPTVGSALDGGPTPSKSKKSSMTQGSLFD